MSLHFRNLLILMQSGVNQNSMKKQTVFAISFSMLLFFQTNISRAQGTEHWITAWATAAYAQFSAPGVPEEPSLENKTIRMVIRPTLGGHSMRVRFSNEFGSLPVRIGAAHVAVTDRDSTTKQGTDHILSFAGKSSVSIPAGAPLISDPVEMDITPFTELTISIYLPAKTPVTTLHGLAKHTSWFAAGDQSGSLNTVDALPRDSWFFLSSLEVLAPESASAIVAFGDSITDGAGAGVSHYADWPDKLAQRFAASRPNNHTAILNEGISGNRILHDAAGTAALARFDRDVLGKSGVKGLIVLEGINDIGFPRIRMEELKSPSTPKNPFVSEKVSAEEIIAGLQQLIVRAHEHGLLIFGATLTPCEGTNSWDAEGEAIRQRVNQWIRAAGAYDGFIDFDSVIRDPEHPSRMKAIYDSGDHIHPNDAGYQVMANAIDLNMLQTTK
jgi:lysophospholipase L1-like esterase